MELRDKVALVTGAGSGIGKASALRLAREGARVGLLARTEDTLNAAAEEIRAVGGEALVVPADTAEPEAVEGAVKKIIDAWGRLDIVLANAGVNGVWAPIDEITPEEWSKTIAINLTGTFLTLHYAVPHLKRQGGSVVITASVNGTRVFSNAGATAYSCTKAGQVALAQMAALELAPHKIRVNVICPGAIESEIEASTEKRDTEGLLTPARYPQGKVPLTGGAPGSAEQVAELVLFLASDRASHITGTPIWIDGAESLLQG